MRNHFYETPFRTILNRDFKAFCVLYNDEKNKKYKYFQNAVKK